MNEATGQNLRIPGLAFEIQLAEQKDGAEQLPPREIQVLKTGRFSHPRYGKFTITEKTLAEMVKNFAEGVRKVDIALDYRHKSDDIAAAWFKKLFTKDNGTTLWAEVDWTKKGAKTVLEKEFRYTSPDFTDNYQDTETLKTHGATLFGAALTNRPFLKGMKPAVELTELSEQENEMNELEKAQGEVKRLGEEVTSLKDGTKKLSEAGYTPLTALEKIQTLSTDNAKLMAEKAQAAKELQLAEKKGKFDKMLSENKAVEAQREAFMSGDFEKFAELAQPLNKDAKGHGGAGGDAKKYQLSEEEKTVCKSLGLSEEDFITYNNLG